MACFGFMVTSCEPEPEPDTTLQQKPHRSAGQSRDTTSTTVPDPPNPNDSILPAHIEKWILFFSADNPGCGPDMRIFWPMSDNWFCPDARAITLNWQTVNLNQELTTPPRFYG
jgi:hypothetical protein